MNRSKLLSASALASVMAASAAHAEMSISGYTLGAFYDSDGGGLANMNTSQTITVSYSDTLNNGMGLSIGMDITTDVKSKISLDTGMGTVMFSADGKVSSALDNNDGSPVCFGLFYCGAAYDGTVYNDGDEVSGNSIGYSSPTFNGFQVHLTHGLAGSYDNSDHGGSATEPVNSTDSIAVTGSIMGASLKAAVASIDYDQIGWNQPGGSNMTDNDPSMYSIGYSIAGLDLGYAVYDSDDTASTEETQYGVGTTLMGMYVGAQFATKDSTTDTDYMTLSVVKDMGPAQFSYEYIETDVANTATGDKDAHYVGYQFSF